MRLADDETRDLQMAHAELCAERVYPASTQEGKTARQLTCDPQSAGKTKQRRLRDYEETSHHRIAGKPGARKPKGASQSAVHRPEMVLPANRSCALNDLKLVRIPSASASTPCAQLALMQSPCAGPTANVTCSIHCLSRIQTDPPSQPLLLLLSTPPQAANSQHR